MPHQSIATENDYTLVGEIHTDNSITDDVVVPLLETGEYETFFFEGLSEGTYGEPDQSLQVQGERRSYECRDSGKYDRIVDTALENGVEVFGLASDKDIYGDAEMRSWADIIGDNAETPSLILVGAEHVYPEMPELFGALSEEMERRDMDFTPIYSSEDSHPEEGTLAPPPVWPGHTPNDLDVMSITGTIIIQSKEFNDN